MKYDSGQGFKKFFFKPSPTKQTKKVQNLCYPHSQREQITVFVAEIIRRFASPQK